MRFTRPAFTIPFALAILISFSNALAPSAAALFQKHEDFTRDPHWQTYSTRHPLAEWPTIRQNFGWNSNNNSLGGLIARSTTPASYARVIPTMTLKQKLSASGKFRVTKNFGNSGMLFGWFNNSSRGWRTPDSLVFRIDGNGPGYWIFFEYGTRSGLTAGKGCFEGERYQTTPTKPFSADGTAHSWSLDYDPKSASEEGLITFTLDGKPWMISVDARDKLDGAAFNRFGILNVQLSGDAMEASFWDIVLDGERIDLSSDPKWEERGSKTNFTDRVVRPFNDAKWQSSSRAGGEPGELGGVLWRDDPPAFYAAPVGKLSLKNELFAKGRIVMTSAAADSGVYFGWFNAASKTNRGARDREVAQTNSLAIAIEGPSRVGHYFRAACWNSEGRGVLQESGPIIPPDEKSREWSLRYSPKGRGEIFVTLGDEKISIALPEGMRERGATFDHFGFFNFQPDGHYVEVYVDNLEFTASREQ